MTALAAEQVVQFRGDAQVVIIEDHALLAESLAHVLGANGYNVDVLGTNSAAEILADVAELQPDLALLDLHLGAAGSGLELIEPLRRAGVAVICITGEKSQVVWGACLEAGALTVVDKTRTFDAVLTQIQAAFCGETTMPVVEREELLNAVREHRHTERVRLEPFQRLTARECDVLESLVQGYSAEAISERAFVSVPTVRSHIRSILQKLGVGSQLAAVAMAVRANWSSPHHRSRES